MKIKFELDDDLRLGKILSIPVRVIIVRSVFQESSNYYPQFFYMSVSMSMTMNMKLMLIPLYK